MPRIGLRTLQKQQRGGKRNPLEPGAATGDPTPHRIWTSMRVRPEHYLGVHTTPNERLAAIYAYNKALATRDSIAIILELDVAGLEALPDADAIQQFGDRRGSELFDDDAIVTAYEARDEEALLGALQAYHDMIEAPQAYPPTEYNEALGVYTEGEQAFRVCDVLEGAADPIAVLDYIRDEGALPLEMIAEALEQWRFLQPIGLDRLLRVRALRPVRPELWGEHEDDPGPWEQPYPDDDPDQPQIFTIEDSSGEGALPDEIVIWDSGRRVDEPHYHGTDITRARAAFPEIADELVNPWAYTQDEA